MSQPGLNIIYPFDYVKCFLVFGLAAHQYATFIIYFCQLQLIRFAKRNNVEPKYCRFLALRCAALGTYGVESIGVHRCRRCEDVYSNDMEKSFDSFT